MAFTALPSPEVLRQLIRYEPGTGKLFWMERAPDQMKFEGRNSPEHRSAIFNRNFAGRLALSCPNKKGYLTGSVNGTGFLAHRVIWKMQTGSDPSAQIDHINGVVSDNRWANLREAQSWQNAGNVKKRTNAKHSKYRGVCKAMATGHWTAAISLNGKQKHIGSFGSECDAARAFDKMAHLKYGPFARLNFPEEYENAGP